MSESSLGERIRKQRQRIAELEAALDEREAALDAAESSPNRRRSDFSLNAQYAISMLGCAALGAVGVWLAVRYEAGEAFLYADRVLLGTIGCAGYWFVTEVATPHFNTLAEVRRHPIGLAIHLATYGLILANCLGGK
jgi:hypothetical protein